MAARRAGGTRFAIEDVDVVVVGHRDRRRIRSSACDVEAAIFYAMVLDGAAPPTDKT